ncbi:MAG: hypothetical protein HUK08_01455 [Bacteroidaceae bacterium]|nr:hypothetical protein [Bacteroidaceae bacterium]
MFRIFLAIFAAATFVACDDMESELSALLGEEQNIKIFEPEFKDNDYKHFNVGVKIGGDLDPLLLSVSKKDKIRLLMTENRIGALTFSTIDDPQILSYDFVLRDSIQKSGERLILLVDLTLEQQSLEKISILADRCSDVFGKNAYLATFNGNTTMPPLSIKASHIHKDLVSTGSERKSLIKAVTNTVSTIPENMRGNSRLLVFSDGRIYNDETDESLDPDHISDEDQLIELLESDEPLPVISYIDMGNVPDEEIEETEVLMKALTEKTKGIYLDSLENSRITSFITNLKESDPDYILYCENPDGKRYAGIDRNLKLDITYNDSIIASGETTYSLGTVYRPIVVNVKSLWEKTKANFIFILTVILIVYIMMQFVIPYIKYMLWYKQNVYTYTGPNMSAGGNLVAERCCYCKDEFKQGDTIVANCKHQMHLDCWEENGCKCPEHGYHNHQSSHYYNRRNIFDPKNASYLMTWIIAGLLAALVAFTLYCIFRDKDDTFIYAIVCRMFDLSLDNPKDIFFLNTYAGKCFSMPDFLAWQVMTLVCYLHLMLAEKPLASRNMFFLITHLVLFGFISYNVSFGFALISTYLNIYTTSFWFDWIPYLVVNLLIIWGISTVMHISRAKIIKGAVMTTVAAVLCIYLFALSSRILMLFDLNLISCCVYIIGLGLTFATPKRLSACYYLHVTGQTKEMDIAIFKLLRTNERSFITLGRSIDCDLQINWDTESPIEPLMARISKNHRNKLMLTALEPGMTFNGSELKHDTPVTLTHGASFTIGRTKFTYIEKDM